MRIYESGTNVPDTYKRLRSQVAARVPTPKAEDSQCAGGHRDKNDTLYGLICRPKRLPTPLAGDATGSRGTKGKDRPDEGGLLSQVKRLPTPTVQDASNNCGPSQKDRDALNVAVGGALNPDWVEWLMGWPIGWTDLQPLETHKYQQWLRSHGKS